MALIKNQSELAISFDHSFRMGIWSTTKYGGCGHVAIVLKFEAVILKKRENKFFKY